MFKLKLLEQEQEQGFTLVEVLVAILMTTLFVGVAMQSMVIAAVFKARAQEFSEATTWIQEDLEYVKYKAANFQYTSLVNEDNGDSIPGKHEATDTVLYVTSVDGFQDGDTLIVGNDSTNNTIATGGINSTTKSITLTAALGTDLSKDTVVVATTKCNAASIDLGFADGLRDQLTGVNSTDTNYIETSTKNSNRTNKAFTFRRITTRSNTSPYDLLQVRYSVTPTSGSSPVTGLSTEVIPNATFQCP